MEVDISSLKALKAQLNVDSEFESFKYIEILSLGIYTKSRNHENAIMRRLWERITKTTHEL